MIVYEVATKELDTESFPQHNIADLNSGITFIVLFSQEKPLRWKEINTHTNTNTHTHTHTHTHTNTVNIKHRFHGSIPGQCQACAINSIFEPATFQKTSLYRACFPRNFRMAALQKTFGVILSKAVVRRYSPKQVSLKISQISPENTCLGVYF